MLHMNPFPNLSVLLAAITSLGSAAFAASPGNYSFLAGPGQNPDAVLDGTSNVDAWAVGNTGTTGSATGMVGSTPVWSIWCYGGGGGGIVAQTHTFVGGALAVGQTVSIDYAHNYNINNGATIGLNLIGAGGFAGAGGPAVTVAFTGNSPMFKFSDSTYVNVSTGQDYNQGVLMPFSFTLTSATTYCATFNGHTWTGTVDTEITGIQVFNNNAGDFSDQYSANLKVAAATAIPGTYAVLASSNVNPDAVWNGTTDVDAWTVVQSGATGCVKGSIGATPVWSIWCWAGGGGGVIAQTHAFAGGMLATGQTVSLDYAHNTNIDTDATVGIQLLSVGGSGVTIAFTGGSSMFKFTDATHTSVSTGQDYNANVLMPFSFTVTSATTYTASLNGHTWTGTLDAPVTGIQLFNNNAGNNSDQSAANLQITAPQPSLRISSVQMLAGNTQIQFTVLGLVVGSNYKVRDSVTLAGFADVVGSQFTASQVSQVITLPVAPDVTPKRFFQVVDIP